MHLQPLHASIYWYIIALILFTHCSSFPFFRKGPFRGCVHVLLLCHSTRMYVPCQGKQVYVTKKKQKHCCTDYVFVAPTPSFFMTWKNNPSLHFCVCTSTSNVLYSIVRTTNNNHTCVQYKHVFLFAVAGMASGGPPEMTPLGVRSQPEKERKRIGGGMLNTSKYLDVLVPKCGQKSLLLPPPCHVGLRGDWWVQQSKWGIFRIKTSLSSRMEGRRQRKKGDEEGRYPNRTTAREPIRRTVRMVVVVVVHIPLKTSVLEEEPISHKIRSLTSLIRLASLAGPFDHTLSLLTPFN